MRSAYLVLGVPGDASQEEIEAAFRRAEAQFPRQRLAEEEGALARLDELRAAYNVLKDPAARAAHDRKLVEAVRPPRATRTVVVEEEASPLRKLLVAGLLLVALVFSAGIYVTHRNAEARRLAVAQEVAARKQAAQEAEEKRQREERQAQERQAQAARAAEAERRLLLDAQLSTSRAEAAMRQRESEQRALLVEAQRSEARRADEERRAAAEARMRVERDKQRVREICLQLYRRPDC